jgi:hypothetical protein
VVGKGRGVDDAARSAIREVVLELLSSRKTSSAIAADGSILRSVIGRRSRRRSWHQGRAAPRLVLAQFCGNQAQRAGREDVHVRSCPASSAQPGMPATPAASPDAAVAAAAKTVLIGLSKNLEGQRRADFASTMQWDSNRPSIAVRLAFVAASLSAPHETERQRHALSLFRSASNDR